jgi:glycosyltransferase involved in cell wall biosynthesis
VPCDPEATADALRSVLADPAWGRQMGNNGRQWAAEHLLWSAVAAQMADAYKDTMQVTA